MEECSTDQTIIAGIVIPSTSPFFLALVGLHILFALVCVITGVVAMLSKKGPGRHPSFGAIYYWCLLAVFVSATILAAMRWSEDYHLFIIGLFSFTAASLGRASIKRMPHNRITLHITGMGSSYTLMLIAFYVDNGRNLPVWKDLPPMLYWLLPAAIGAPLIVRALLRYR